MKQFSKDLGNVSLAPKGKWSREQEYERLALVYNACDNLSYVAKTNVPSGIDIENREYWQPMNATGYADNNFINLTTESETGTVTAYESLEEAVATILPINRRAGATLSFYNLNADRLDRQAEFELWQFNSTDLANWENRDYWNNIYYNWNVFAGWYVGADGLKNHVKIPNVGQYAYVGTNLNDALLYQCRTNGTWTNTGIKVRNYISVVVSGNITIGENGNWFSDGKDTGIPATPAVDEQLDNIIMQLQQHTIEIDKLQKQNVVLKSNIDSNFETINNKVDNIKTATDDKIDAADANLQNQITSNDTDISILNTKHESLSKTVQGIAVTGGASTATNVTYDKTNSGLNAENVQDAIDEISSIVIYDVSACNGGVVFESLQSLLSSDNLSTLIPTAVRCGGMSIRFVQSSDNKYVKFFCIADEFTTDVSKWQGVDNEPTAGSDNLVKSGGVDYRTGSLQSNIDNITGVNNNPIDLSLYPEKDYYLNNNGIWRANANYGLKIIPIYSLQGGSITIKANDNTEFAFLKQDNLGNDNTADICDGTTKRYCAQGSITTATIPDDCNYIYIYTRSDSIDKSPQSVTVTKKGMLYTSVIKTDVDINIQSETLNDILRIFDKDANVVVYDDLKPYSGWIGENGYENVGNANRTHKVVAIKGGASIIIKSLIPIPFYVVKSYIEPITSGQSPDFASGETGRRMTIANKDYSFVAPSDANYLVFGYKYDNTIHIINNLLINGYNVTKSLKYNLISLKSSSISDFDGNTDISATTLNKVIEKQNADVECTTYDNLKQHSGWIEENGYGGVGNANRTHKVVKVRGNSKIIINSKIPVPFYVVKSYTEPKTSGESPDYATGEIGRRITKAGENFSFVLPSDAKYLVLGYKYDNIIHDIYKIVVDGYNVIDSIKENLLQPSIGNDYEGEKISICNKFRFENLPIITGGQYHQACAIYSNYMIVVGNSVEEDNVATIPVYIVNLITASVESTINLPYDNVFPHCSVISFSRTFVDGSDFPLLYVSVNTVENGRGCLVYSITNTSGVWSMTLVQTISVNIDSTQFGAGDNAWVVDYDENKLYSFAFTLNQPYYVNNGNSMKVCVFNLPDTSSESVTLTSEDIKENYELEHFTYLQDACYSCGCIYFACGGGASYAHTNVLRVVNTLQKKVVSRARYPEIPWEVEGLDIHNGDLLMFGNKILGLKFVFD